jgi:Acetyltransferase (GNAT) domain
MFNTPEWSKITEDTYGYLGRVFESNGFKICYSVVENEIGKYLIAPSFGDFIALEKDGLLTVEKWVSACGPTTVSLKVCCAFKPIVPGLITSPNGFIHQIEYDSYLKWYEEIVTPRFKRNIKKGLKSNLTIKIEKTSEAVRRFWEMHAVLRQTKFKEIPQPWAYFNNIYEIFFKSGQGFIFGVYSSKDDFIAGILVIIHNGTAYYKFNASNLNHLGVRPNNFLIDRLIHYLDGLNVKKLNLGYTGSSNSYEGLRVYKTSAGAIEYSRFTMRTPTFEDIDRSHISEINEEVQRLISRNSSLDEVDQFSTQHYKYFI